MVEETKAKKILIIGLDNSGKTSIVESLKGIKSLQVFSNINPTKGRQIETISVLDSEFNIFDLSGQKVYRKEHLENFNDIVFGSNKLIYVFDVQDTKRYDLALEYFQNIIDLLNDNASLKNIEISIFLHKFDPDLSQFRPDITEEITNNLKEKIKGILKQIDFFYQIFNTTIYAIFEKSITD